MPSTGAQHETALGCGNVIAEVTIDLLGDPTRLCPHMPLHQVPIDQIKAMAIGHDQKVLGSVLVRYHGGSAHRASSCSTLDLDAPSVGFLPGMTRWCGQYTTPVTTHWSPGTLVRSAIVSRTLACRLPAY